MKKDILTEFINETKDTLLLKAKNNTIIAGPEYCAYKQLLKEHLVNYLKTRFKKTHFIELTLPSSINYDQLSAEGYSENFELLKLEGLNRALKSELFATVYKELDDYKHYFGTNVCYFSIGTSFRNEKTTKKRLIRSFEFEQLEFQFYKNNQVTITNLFEAFKDFLLLFSHEKGNLIKEEKSSSDLPFYSTSTHDLCYTLDRQNLQDNLELCSISERNNKEVVELSLGVVRMFITSLIDSSKKETLIGKELKKLETKFTKKYLK